MTILLIMGLVMIVSLAVIGGLLYLMSKDTQKTDDGKAVLITDISELKRQMAVDEKKASESLQASVGTVASDDPLLEAKSKLATLEEEATHAPKDELLSVVPIEKSVESEIKFSKIIGADAPEAPGSIAADEPRSQEKVAELEIQLQLISEKAVRQAEEAVQVIEALMKENQELKASQDVSSSIGPTPEEVQKSILELKERNGLLENQLDLSAAKVSQLESQIAIVKKEMGQQLLEANAAIARLKVESEAQDRVSSDVFLKEKEQADEWRQKTNAELRQMEDDLMRTKEESLLLKDTKKLLEAKLAVMQDDYKKELAESKEFASSLAQQKQTDTQRCLELEQNISKLKDLNTTLIDKAKVLQYELNRQRAQASGLERVCETFKSQMEGLFGQVEQTKKDNNRLLQERMNLEVGVESLRSENSKLLERDRIYQAELEKTKEQVTRFEKIYDNFKSNVSDAGKEKPRGS